MIDSLTSCAATIIVAMVVHFIDLVLLPEILNEIIKCISFVIPFNNSMMQGNMYNVVNYIK